MDSDSALTNAGYGQDKMLVNPIHMAMIYSTFANGGNMVMPIIQREEKNKLVTNISNSTSKNEIEYYKENVISKESLSPKTKNILFTGSLYVKLEDLSSITNSESIFIPVANSK